MKFNHTNRLVFGIAMIAAAALTAVAGVAGLRHQPLAKEVNVWHLTTINSPRALALGLDIPSNDIVFPARVTLARANQVLDAISGELPMGFGHTVILIPAGPGPIAGIRLLEGWTETAPGVFDRNPTG